MTELKNREAIIYLLSLKEYEFQKALKKPIGQRVKYYLIQTDWITEMLKDEYNKSLLHTVYSFEDYLNIQKGAQA